MSTMADLVNIVLNNPYIGQFLSSLTLSFGTETGKRVSGWIFDSLEGKLRSNKTPQQEIDKAKRHFSTFTQKKDNTAYMSSLFWMEFLNFMFPERLVDGNALTQEDCAYIIARTYAASEFHSLLCDLNYDQSQIKYMAQIQGKSKSVYNFDLKAWYRQEYFDNLLIGRVIDNRIGVPTEYINGLPMLVQDINGDSTASPATIRDHDLFVLIHTGKIEKPDTIRNAVKTVQYTYDIFLPRILYITERELEDLVTMEKKKASDRLSSRIRELRPYRG